MIYPEKIKAKKSDRAALANAGILYIWVVVIYSIRKNINIAGQVLLQMVALSVLSVYIDYKLGLKGWSINIAIPIMIMIANLTMLVLTIVSYKRYLKYGIYQLMIVLFSMLPVILVTEHIVQDKTLSVIASGISVLNFGLCLALCAKDVKEVIARKFHM